MTLGKHLIARMCGGLLLAAALLAPRASRAQDFFPAGSLIIPTTATYQTACGMVSAYGLVYQLLRANESLAGLKDVNCPGGDSSKGTKGTCSRITIHWAFKTDKDSPNHCVPTDQHHPPPYGSFTKASPPAWNDGNWKGGCDFRVENSKGPLPPVTLVDNANPATDITKDLTLSTISTITGDPASIPDAIDLYAPTFSDWPGYSSVAKRVRNTPLAYPTYPSVAVTYSPGASTNVTSVGYGGGPFIISAYDAQIALALISGKLKVNANDPLHTGAGQPIIFTQFVQKPSAADPVNFPFCNISPSTGQFFFDRNHAQMNVNGADRGSPYANEHHVNIHRAQIGFNAPDTRRMNTTPARIALLQYAGGVGSSSSGSGNGVVGDMLPKYLKSAGLFVANAGGCPKGSVNAGNSHVPECAGGATPGEIYDALDVLDLASSNDPLNHPATPADHYTVFWVPHWDGTAFAATTGPPAYAACDTACVANALSNIYTYANSDNGILAECASIGLFEGTPGARDRSGGGAFSFPTASVDAGTAPFLTCVSTSGTGVCDTPVVAAAQGLVHDELLPYGSTLRNCADPDHKDGGSCINYEQPGEPYAQIGDYLWTTASGYVTEYMTNSNVAYRSGHEKLAYTIMPLNSSLLDTPAHQRSMAVADNFTFIQKDNDPRKARIIYLGGHTYSSYVAGTRVVLNSILALGLVPDTGETAYVGATPYKDLAAIPTYDRVTTNGAPLAWANFSPSTGSQWIFPYHTGHMRLVKANTTSGLSDGNTAFSDAPGAYGNASPAGCDAPDAGASDGGCFNPSDARAVMEQHMTPSSRNIFTYLGGTIATSPDLGVGKKAVNNVLQVGWQPVDIDTTSLNSGCVSQLHIGEVCGSVADGGTACLGGEAATKPNYSGTPYPGMVPGSNGVCDLQQALGLTIGPSDLGSDNGATEQATIISKLTASSAVRDAKELLQMVRGYCYATDSRQDGVGNLVEHPTDNDCNANYGRTGELLHQSARLGALVRSKVTIVGPSALVPDSPAGKVRPTVAYAGGLDGQLHAFYIPSSSDGSDVTGYKGPLQASTPINTAASASNVFAGHTTFGGSAGFSPPVALTELWAFIPPGQLPFLKSNGAKVDSTPAVIDVFGDFDGSGARSWHTVLVASTGGQNREIFALDVTNPLAPVLLWDVSSAVDLNTLAYAPVSLSDDDTGLNTATQAQAFTWSNACYLGDSSVCKPAVYALPPSTVDTGTAGDGSPHGLTFSGPYNFANLGASQSLEVALLRRNNVPIYSAFVATNSPGKNGFFVFAIDIVTGQKIWEFNNPYAPPFGASSWDSSQNDRKAGIGNSTPPGVAVASRARTGLVDTIYAGDDMGRLWELDAQDGVNLTSYAHSLGCTGGGCNWALSDAYFKDGYASPQPVSTLPLLFFLPGDAVGPLKPHAGELMLAYGTAGTDTVSTFQPIPSGVVHLVSLAPNARLGPGDMSTANQTNANDYGVATELGPFPLSNGNRLYGPLAAFGSTLVFSTTIGAVSDIDKRGGLGGETFTLNLSSNTLQTGGAVGATGALNQATSIITNAGGAGGAPVIFYTTASGTSATPNGTITGIRIVTVTDQNIAVKDIPMTGISTTDITSTADLGKSVTGKQGGANGTAGFFGWFFRSLGLEY